MNETTIFIMLIAPLAAQGLAMIVDEFYFHYRRGLPKWERWGHPIDTFSVLLTLAIPIFLDFEYFPLYVGLAVLSCICVSKDEWIHSKFCEPGEQWLHSLLFLLHPLVFLSIGIMWAMEQNVLLPNYSSSGSLQIDYGQILWSQIFVVSAVLIYQTVYWNFIYKSGKAPSKKLESEHINNEIYHTLGDRWYLADDDPIALLRAEFRTIGPWVIRKIRPLSQELKAPPSEIHCLDVGCGGGFLSNYLAQQGLQVTGLDLSEESLKIAKKYDSTQSVKYLCHNAYSLPFSDQSFDVVTCMDFLEHVEKPQEVIREISRVLRPGGYFLFHTFNRTWQARLVVVKVVEWFVKNTPKNLHLARMFLKPAEVASICESVDIDMKEFRGLSPALKTLKFKNLVSGTIPHDFKFVLSNSLAISYVGFGKKKDSIEKSTTLLG